MTTVAAYPEHPLSGRNRLAHRWIPRGVPRLLDAGCSYGYATRFFAERARRTAGVDVDAEAVAVARERYPDIEFAVAGLEALPFDDAAFEAVVCCDVLEHVDDERASLDELCRVLAPGGTLILSTPHRGALGFLDPVNLPAKAAPALRRLNPALYERLREQALGEDGQPWWETQPHHRHYALGDLRALLDASAFARRYEIRDVVRSGILPSPAGFADAVTGLAPVPPAVARVLARTGAALEAADYWVPWGPAAFNIAVRLRKT